MKEWTHANHNEDFLNDVILQHKHTFLDIGANIGAWTVRAAPYYRYVIAVEPIFHKYLRKTVRLNHISNVTIVPYALGWNHIKPGITDDAVERSVKSLPLDDLGVKPSVVKIDAEGAAYQIIVEGFSTIRKHRPLIVVEVHTAEERRVTDLLQDYAWERRFREMPPTDHIYREEGKQVFLIGRPITK